MYIFSTAWRQGSTSDDVVLIYKQLFMYVCMHIGIFMLGPKQVSFEQLHSYNLYFSNL